MDLSTMKAMLAENTNHVLPLGEGQVERLLNRAYEHIVNLVEQTAKNYNMEDTPETVSVVNGTQDYELTSSIRKILHVERTDLGGDPIGVRIIPFQRKNEFARGTYASQLGGHALAPTVYFTRRVNDGRWHLEFPSNPGGSIVLSVYYAPLITEMATETAEPYQVPEQFHELIIIRATRLALIQARIPAQQWDQEYVEMRGLMMADLETWNRTGPRSRILRTAIA